VQAVIMLNGTEEDAGAIKPTKQPRYTKLTQQELDACKPVLDATWAVFIFAAITFIMIPIGAVCYVYGMKPVEYAIRYDMACPEQKAVFPPGQYDRDAAQRWLQENQNEETGVDNRALQCQVTFQITQDMQPPIYVYYELDGVYQNHRRYVKSRSDAQLKGELADIKDAATARKQLGACEPQLFYNVSARAVCGGLRQCGSQWLHVWVVCLCWRRRCSVSAGFMQQPAGGFSLRACTPQGGTVMLAESTCRLLCEVCWDAPGSSSSPGRVLPSAAQSALCMLSTS
jgi:hypothetical protein